MKKLILSLTLLFPFLLKAQDYNVTLPQQCNTPNPATNETIIFPNTPANANSDATLTIVYQGDLDGGPPPGTEYLDFLDESLSLLGTTTSQTQCSGIGTFTTTIPMSNIIAWAADGQIDFTVDPGTGVNSLTNCVNGLQVGYCVTVSLQYGVSTGPNDIGVFSIDSPTVYCPGPQNVVATIINYGTNAVTSATVNWTVDGVSQTPFSFSGTLDTIGGSGSSSAQVNLGSFNFATNNPYDVVVWTSNPNGVADTVNSNDTVSMVMQSSLPPPGNISVQTLSATQATLTWSGGSNNSWLWVNVPAGNPVSGSGAPVATNSATVTGLMSETGYDFYVREVCPTGDTSAWAGPFFYITPFQCPPNAYCFLTCGATGSQGPTQSDCNTIYSGSNLNGQVTVTGGIQNWSVPSGGLYEITVYGAQGFGPFGGRGAQMSGEFLFNGGEQLKILVGQKGAPPVGAGTNQFGGGGGTFITDNANNPIIIAGGGGGSWAPNYTTTTDASIGTAGNAGMNGPGSGAGGINGLGGASSSSADGGAGLLGDGGGTAGGQAFINGGLGGLAPTNGGEGGFGGGGGASSWNNRRGGGGGGYSGGGGAGSSTTSFPEGGGGGSFNSGANQVNQAGVRFNDGVVIIKTLSSGAPNDIGVISIDSPTVFCPGPQNVVVSINNFGTNPVTSATVNWSVDGVTQTPATFSGTLDTIGGAGATTAQVVLGSFNFATNNPYDLVVWSSNPNGSTDTVGTNDTASTIIQSSLPPPSNLMTTVILGNQATVVWSGGSNNSWLYNLIPAGNPNSGSGTPVSNPTVTLQGLTPLTAYDFYVREVCPTGDTSAWAGPLSFATPFLCPQNSYCFSTCGATGQNGPSQTDANTTYAGTPLAGNVTVNNGIQFWVVPSSGVYQLNAIGAAGGGANGGLGANLTGDFTLVAGDTLLILTGQEGFDPADNSATGGGGTFVAKIDPGSAFTMFDGRKVTPLIIAGGGGGNPGVSHPDVNASTGPNGLNGNGVTGSGIGGTAGNGGGLPQPSGNNRGGAGGGFLTDGDNSGTCGAGLESGLSFLNGGTGGLTTGCGTPYAGGFGGGGGAISTGFRGSGGGGGYSGGGGGQNNSNTSTHRGGGGGSLNSGANPIGTLAAAGEGRLIITPLSSGAANDIGVVTVGPVGTYCPGVQNVDATILNFGITQVDSFTVNWAVNGAIQPPVNVVTPLDTFGGTGATSHTLTLGTNNFVFGQTYTLEAWSTMPNAMADTLTSNDSSSTTILVTVPGVASVNVSNVLDVSASISWTELGTAGQWEITYGPPGFTPGSAPSVFTNSNPHTLTGLMSNTDYCVYVRSICGPGDTSAWEGPSCFLTSCGLFASPTFETFDGPQWTPGGATGTIDQCWFRDRTTAPWWNVEDLNTSSGSTGPSGDVSGTGQYVYLESSGGSTGDSSVLEMPWMDLGAANTPQLVFYYHMYGSQMGTLKAQASSDGTSWSTVFSITGQQQGASADPWIKTTVPLTGFNNDTIKVRFVGVRGTGLQSDMAIDEVKVQQAPANDLESSQIQNISTGCGLTANESFVVTVTNQGSNDQDTFDIEYNLNGGPWIVGATITTTLVSGASNNYTVTGVDLSTPGNYCIEARAVIPVDDDPTNDVTPQVCVQHLTQPSISSIQEGENCGAGPMTLSVTSNAATVEWYDDPALTNMVNTGTTYSIANISTTTTYYVQGTNANGCQTAPVQVQGVVSTPASVDYTFAINGATVDFTSAISGTFDSIFWDFGDLTGSTQSNPSHTYSSTQTYLVVLTAYSGSCVSDTAKAIFVNVGLEDKVFGSEIQLFPNPSDGHISLSIPSGGEDIILLLTDMEGKTLSSQQLKKGDDRIEADVYFDTAPGNYLLKVVRGETFAIKRISIIK